MSRRGYASARGVDEKTIRKAIEAGKIRCVDGKIDPETADADWLRNRDTGQASKLAEAVVSGSSASPPSAPVAPSQSSIAADPQFDLAPLTAARIRNTDESTAFKEINRRKLEGQLLELEEVERTWGQVLQVLKDRLRLMPDNLAPALVACTDEAACRSLLAREIQETLAAVSKGVEGLAA